MKNYIAVAGLALILSSPVFASPALANARLLDGNWCTEAGLLRIRVGLGTNVAQAAILSNDGKVTQYLMDLKIAADNRSLEGTWFSTASGSVREWISMTPGSDGRTLTASVGGSVGIRGRRVLTGVLKSTDLSPAPDICAGHLPDTGGDPQPQPQPQPQPGPEPEPAAHQSLGRFDVQLDKVVEARGYPTRQVHAFVTLKNATPAAQYITSGVIRAILTDADGIGQERNQVWNATAEPAALFNATPVIRPGAVLQVRYVFTPDEGAVPSTLTLMEGGKTVAFPVSGF